MEDIKKRFKNKSFMNWDTTLELARQELARSGTPEEIASRTGATYDQTARELIVPFLGEMLRVSYPEGEIRPSQRQELTIQQKIVVLHYLTHAEGTSLKGSWISFKELPSGQIYITPFTNRTIRPLLKFFGERYDDFVKAGELLGGKREQVGDASFTITVFPKVKITYVLWKGDDEFPASATILFDEAAPHYLPTEDYTVLSSMLVFEMDKILKTQAGKK